MAGVDPEWPVRSFFSARRATPAVGLRPMLWATSDGCAADARRTFEDATAAMRAILGTIILAGAALCGCSRSADRASAAASFPAVTVAAAAVKSVTPAGTFVGRVQAVNTVNLVSRVEGFLQKRAFTEGQQVKTGDLLFVIEQDTYQAAVDQAQAQLASAQATERNAAIALQRSQELVKTNAVAQATVDQNLANQGTASAAVRGAQAALSKPTSISPSPRSRRRSTDALAWPM